MKFGTLQRGDVVMLRWERAEAFGCGIGPWVVLYVKPNGRYRSEWLALDGIDDGQGGQGFVSNKDVQKKLGSIPEGAKGD